jgi:hypothetical protein
MPRLPLILAALLAAGSAAADSGGDSMTIGETSVPVPQNEPVGADKLLLTGGVNSIEGTAGGGLTPWAVIGGYGTRDQIGANAFYTRVGVQHYHLDDAGIVVGLFNRVELSYARQRFDTEDVGAALGLGRGFTLGQDILGVKLRIAGDAVLEQDSWMPQFAVGLQYKKAEHGDILHAVGARDDQGTDFYVSATKLYLAQSLLLDGTLRFTKANQTGLLGFGGDRHDDYRPQFEGSIAWLLNRRLAIGAEYRSKPDNLGIAGEDDWFDLFLAWAPTKHITVTVAYVNLGNVVIQDNQHGLYASLQVGF